MSLVAKYKSLPRAGKWLAWLVLGTAVYFLGVEPLVEWTASMRTTAQAAQRRLDQQARLAAQADQSGGLIARGLSAYGVPPAPSASGDPLDALNQRIDRLAREHDVQIKRRTERPRAPLSGVDWSGRKLERVGVEVTLECTTPQLVALLKDLEAASEIHALTQVRVQKVGASAFRAEPGEDPGILQVTLLPETFVLPRGTRTGGAR